MTRCQSSIVVDSMFPPWPMPGVVVKDVDVALSREHRLGERLDGIGV